MHGYVHACVPLAASARAGRWLGGYTLSRLASDIERLTVELEKGEPPTFFWKQKLPTFTWQLKEDEKLKGAVARASIARTDFTRSTAYYCLLFPLFRPSRASAADSLAPFGASWRAKLAFWFVHNTHRVHLPRVTGTLKASWLLYFPRP